MLDGDRARRPPGVRDGRRLQRHGHRARLGATRWSAAAASRRAPTSSSTRRSAARSRSRRASHVGDTLTALGYPAAGKYHGSDLVYCQGKVGTDPNAANTTYRMACDMTGGSSGGPWLLNVSAGYGARLTSLNSYGYSGVKNMYGPIFNSETSATLHHGADDDVGRRPRRAVARRDGSILRHGARPAATPASPIPRRSAAQTRPSPTMAAHAHRRRRAMTRTAAAPRARSRGSRSPLVMWVLVVAGSDPTIDVTEPFSGQLVTAQDARSYYGLDLDDLYTGRTELEHDRRVPVLAGVRPARLPARPAAVAGVRGGLDGDPASARCTCSPGRDLFLLGLGGGRDGDRGRQRLACCSRSRSCAGLPLAVRPGRSCC